MKTLLYTLLLLPFVSQAQIGITVTPNLTDNTLQINNAINSAHGAYLTVVLGAGQCPVSGTQNFLYDNVNFVVDTNATRIYPNASYPKASDVAMFQGYGKKIYSAGSTTSRANISCTKTSVSFTTSDAASIPVGSIVVLLGDAYATPTGDPPYNYGHFATVVSKSGTTITLNAPFLATFSAYKIDVYKPLKNIRIRGLRLDLNGLTDGRGVVMKFVNYCSITGFKINGTPGNSATGPRMGIQVEADSMDIRDGSIRDFLPAYTGTSRYAINPQGNNVLVKGVFMDDVGVGIESGGRLYMSTIDEVCNYIHATRVTIGSHGNTGGIIAHNICIVDSGGAEKNMSSRAFIPTTIFKNWILIKSGGHTSRAIWNQENGYDGQTIDSNVIAYVGGTYSNNMAYAASNIFQPVVNMKFRGNKLYGCRFYVSGGTNLTITGNTMYTASGIVGTIQAPSCTGCTISGNPLGGASSPPDPFAWTGCPADITGTPPVIVVDTTTHFPPIPEPCTDCEYDLIHFFPKQ